MENPIEREQKIDKAPNDSQFNDINKRLKRIEIISIVSLILIVVILVMSFVNQEKNTEDVKSDVKEKEGLKRDTFHKLIKEWEQAQEDAE